MCRRLDSKHVDSLKLAYEKCVKSGSQETAYNSIINHALLIAYDGGDGKYCTIERNHRLLSMKNYNKSQKKTYNKFNDVKINFILNSKPSMDIAVLLCTLSSHHASRHQFQYSKEQLISLSRMRNPAEKCGRAGLWLNIFRRP
uniref:Uncharacterized protein n=1 Tax=Panagrolaimus davidi TaxID=227884 RepID=A0A914QDG6_9BILA